MFNVKNHLKNSKIYKIRLKWNEIDKITILIPILRFQQKHILHCNNAIYVSFRPIAACHLSTQKTFLEGDDMADFLVRLDSQYIPSCLHFNGIINLP
jgi:hypothetical protein